MPSFKVGRLAVVSLPAADVISTAHFYRDVVGLRLLPHHSHRPAFELENECYLVIVPGKPDTSPGTEEETSPGTEEAPSPRIEEESSPGTEEETSPGAEEEPSPGTEEEPSPGTEEETFPAIAFAVDDLDRAVERLEENRVKTPWGIETSAGERWVKFYDPAGNLIEFAQFK